VATLAERALSLLGGDRAELPGGYQAGLKNENVFVFLALAPTVLGRTDRTYKLHSERGSEHLGVG
jgi:hypothetical protein